MQSSLTFDHNVTALAKCGALLGISARGSGTDLSKLFFVIRHFDILSFIALIYTKLSKQCKIWKGKMRKLMCALSCDGVTDEYTFYTVRELVTPRKNDLPTHEVDRTVNPSFKYTFHWRSRRSITSFFHLLALRLSIWSRARSDLK